MYKRIEVGIKNCFKINTSTVKTEDVYLNYLLYQECLVLLSKLAESERVSLVEKINKK